MRSNEWSLLTMKAITVIDKNYTLIYTGNVQPCVLPMKKVGYASSLGNDYNLQMDIDIVGVY